MLDRDLVILANTDYWWASEG